MGETFFPLITFFLLEIKLKLLKTFRFYFENLGFVSPAVALTLDPYRTDCPLRRARSLALTLAILQVVFNQKFFDGWMIV